MSASRLSIGTAQFGLAYGVSNSRGRPGLEAVRRIFADAAAAGVSALDTAPVYGDAEEVVMTALPAGHGFRIVTKTVPASGGIDGVVSRAWRSHETFGGQRLDGLLVHATGDLAGSDGPALWRAMSDLKDRGVVRAIGFSAYLSDDPVALAKRYRPDMVQLPLSILDQRAENAGILQELKALGVEIQARSVFLQGAVFLNPSELPPALAHMAGWLDHFHARLEAHAVAPLGAGLGYAFSRLEVDRVVVGVTDARELAAILGALGDLPSLDWPTFACNDQVLLDPRRW